MKKITGAKINSWGIKLIFSLAIALALLFVSRTMIYADTLFYDNFDYHNLTGWIQQATHGTQFSQSGNTIRIIHSTADNGFDNIMQTFDPLAEAVFEFDAKIGSANNDNFSLLLESDGGYAAGAGLGLAFKANTAMVYAGNSWQAIYTVPFDLWQHYRIVSTAGWIAIYINDDLKYKWNGSFNPRSFIQFSDFGLCSGTVTNYITNVRVRTATVDDKFMIYEDFNNQPLTGWTQNATHGTQFSQSSNSIRIVHSTTPNGFDSIRQQFMPIAEAVFEFDAKIGSVNNDNFSLLLQSDGGYSAVGGLGIAFKANTVMVYADNNWQTIYTIAFDVWLHYRIVSTPDWIAIYINDDLKYKRSGSFPIRSVIQFSDFGLCSGIVTNYVANVQTRAATANDRFMVYDDFNNQPLIGWTQSVYNGARFSQNSNGIRIIHSTVPGGFDCIRQTFDSLPEAVFEFDAKIGSENNDNFSLLLESDGGYNAAGGLGLAFKTNTIMVYNSAVNDWQAIGTVPFNEWRHYRIVSTPDWFVVYINDDLKYRIVGSFQSRSFIKFSDFGLCTGAVTNYLANIRTRAATDDDKFIAFDDFDNGILDGWSVNVPNGTQFAPENGMITINHGSGSWCNDYMQRTFDPVQNVVLEFDAKIGAANTSHSLVIATDDSGPNGLFLSFYANTLYAYFKNNTGKNIATIVRDQWNHFRLVYTATKIEVYVNGVLKYTATGTFNPRSYFRFGNYGLSTVTNYIDNVCIRTQVPTAASTDSPEWTSNWTIQNPNGTQFIQTDNQYTINHAMGTQGADYLQREFKPLQNVAFEFDAKIGSLNNSGYSLLIESDGGSGNGGLYLGFNQNTLRGYFGSWQNIQTINADEWNHYRIVSTLEKMDVYVNGVLKYTCAGTFNPRSYLRFSNGGYCTPTNDIRNISIQEVIPDATFTNQPDWSREWLVHNPDGTLFIRENDIIRINHGSGSWCNDYMQRTFDPVQNVVLEFDAKIGAANTSHSLVIATDDSGPNGLFLSFYANTLYAYFKNNAGKNIATIVRDQWNHFRLVYTATKIEVYVNGVLKYTATGTFNPRSYFRFGNYGLSTVTNYIDNVCIRTQVPVATVTNPPDWTTDWAIQNPNGTQFIEDNGLYTINHATGTQGADYLQREFKPLQNVAFEFDAKIGSLNNSGYSLLIESNGGSGNGGLYLGFNQNTLRGYFGSWQNIQTINADEWNHYRIVSTLKKMDVYVNGILEYTCAGVFNPRSYLRFSNFGTSTPTNYIKNISIQEAIPDATFTNQPDWSREWLVHNPDGTLFIRENDIIRINHGSGSWCNDYMQRTFDPAQNVVLEFDAKIGAANTSHSLVIATDDSGPNGLFLSFYANTLYAYFKNNTGKNIATILRDQWNHFRLVYTATKIEVYVNGVLKYTATGTFDPRSYFRFGNYGLSTVTNYIDNVCIRTQVPAAASTDSPEWTSNWTIQNPNGTQFIEDNGLYTINHAAGTQGADYLQRSFKPLQNVAFEFDAKIGSENNTNYSLLIESDGGSANGGLYLGFNQNTLRGYFGSWQNIQTINNDQWNHYRIVSTLKKMDVYVNGILKYTCAGTFNPRSYLRFSNGGYCTPTNDIRNISIQEVIPDATFTNQPDWSREWLVHNPDGTLFIRENDIIRINHGSGSWCNDYMQRTFDPVQNVVLDFDAKIGAANTSHSLVIATDDSGPNGLFLSFYANTLYAYFKNNAGKNIATIVRDQWNHFRLVYTATKIEVYVNGVLKYTATGTFNPRSYFRFGNYGLSTVTNYLDNVCIQSGLPQNPVPPYLKVLAPVDGQVIQDGTITVSGEASAQVPVQVTVNGQPATVSAGTFTRTGVALTEGGNTLTVIATDINGGTTQATLAVIRDSTPPVLSNITPVNGAYRNTANITVSGQVSDTSAVTVTVNGTEASVAGGWFSAEIPVHEGRNVLNVTARDAVGNLSSAISSVFVDTQPPAEFTPTADPSGWTDNNQPTVTFAATDAGSGIEHYEIAVNDGAWLTLVTSPYQFTSPIPDGEQTVKVKAIDKAGNYTIGTVKVYIDTTPPAAPERFEVIPGINRVIINWHDPVGDITGYRLYRTPAFSGTPYREVFRSADGSPMERYIDTEVTADTEYSYALAAMDHVGNLSSNTASIPVKVGIAVQTVTTAAATVKFENCQVTLAEEALTEPGQVIMEKFDQSLPASDYAAPVDVTYSIQLQDQTGAETKPVFSAPVTLQLSYNEIELPEGFTTQDLGIYWYNREGGYWEKVDYCINNTTEKTLTVNLKHFSEYQVMASKYMAPSLDSYYNLGLSPYQSYFRNNIENVSTSGGSLLVMATDLSIPGPGGLDLEVKRLYDSGAAEHAAIMEINCRENSGFVGGNVSKSNPIDSFGGGWSLNLPWVESPANNGQFIRLPEGQTIKIEWKDNRFEYHQGSHFILERQTHRYDVFLGWREVTDGYTLKLPDGAQYQFDNKGRPVRRTNPSGKFYLDYRYAGDRKLAGITDAAGRAISFEYSGDKIVKIKSGSGDNYREVQYLYDQNGNLEKVTDPLNRNTAYKYTGLSYRYGTGAVKNDTIQLLTEIDYPTGGQSVYTIESKSQDYIPSGNQTQFGQKYMVKEHSLEEKITRYDYTMNLQNGPVPPNSYVQTAVITEGYYEGSEFHGGKQVRETYRQVVEKGSKDAQGNQITTCYLVETLSNLTNFKGSIVTGSRIMIHPKDTSTDTFQEVEQVNYLYPLEYLKLRLPGSIEHFRGGQQTYLESFSYDITWGNITRKYDGSRNLEETWSYETEHSRIRNLLKSNSKTNKNTQTGTSKTVTTSYTYGANHQSAYWEMGKPDMVTVTDLSTNEEQKTRFTYDEYGNLVNQINQDPKNPQANGLQTMIAYDSIHTYPSAKILRGVTDADGKPVGDITTQYQFNPATGMKKSETDAKGRLTTYDYDAVNRVIRVTLPDDDSKVHPYRQYIFNDSQKTCEFWNENRQKTLFKFDTLGRLTEIHKFKSDNTTLYSRVLYGYDILGRIDSVTDPLGKVTSYQYDGLNRVTTVIFPKNTGTSEVSAKLSYNDITNTVTITDENGGVVTERSDWANRMIQAEQKCSYTEDGTTTIDNFSWCFKYDSFGNKVNQIDPAGNQINQTFDGFGRLTHINLPQTDVILPEANNVTSRNPIIQYGYDLMNNRISQTNPNGYDAAHKENNTIRTDYDWLGRVITVTMKAKKTVDFATGNSTVQTVLTKHYYDNVGNKTRTMIVDAGNPATIYRDIVYQYSARNCLLSEDLVLERNPVTNAPNTVQNIGRYRYDPMGNKIAAIDPRNTKDTPVTWYTISGDTVTITDPRTDKSFTTWYGYDQLNRPVKTILPDDTPQNLSDNPYTEITYDEAGNKTKERDVNGLETSYTYTPRNWVETVSINNQLKMKYTYDKAGNRTHIESVTNTDGVLNRIAENRYDSLGRLRRVIHPLNQEKYGYDSLGNKIWAEDGRGNRTYYSYNALGWLTGVTDPLWNSTHSQYDLNGNRVRQIAANGIITIFNYDEMNRLVEKQIDSPSDSTKNRYQYSYDLAGNREKMRDPRNSSWQYQYDSRNLLTRIEVTGADQQSNYWVTYQYDEAGNRIQVKDNGNTNNYSYDELSRLTQVERNFDGATYTTGYQYDKSLLTGIKYPETTSWLKYNYNSLNQLSEVVEFTAPQGITYDADGALKGIRYANGVITNYSYDANRRLSNLTVTSNSANIQNLNFTYDNSNNIKSINDKTYDYDANNQLIKAVTPGKFLENKETPSSPGLQVADYFGNANLLFSINPQAVISLDYDGTSIGLDFGTVASGIKKILLAPGAGQSSHRINQGTFDLYTSNDNSTYTPISRGDWEYKRDDHGVISITLKQAKAMRYLKIHVWFDNRSILLYGPLNRSTFMNELAGMLRVYREANSRTEEYQYDEAGNRKLTKVTLIQTGQHQSLYYPNSDRLKTDGRYTYTYDKAGNMITKEKALTEGGAAENWAYTYDLLNRLIKVTKNGTIVGEYGYDPEGLRVVKRAHGETVHYVFQGLEPIYTKNLTTGKVKSYVYAGTKLFARVDGVIGDTTAKKYWYHTDQVGSVKAVTNQAGAVVWNADYLPFGTQYTKNKLDSSFEEDDLGFTGKGYDSDVELYYFNARWYDADTGRFISEDPVADPHNPNLYSYGANNPLTNTDPTGLYISHDGSEQVGPPAPDNLSNSNPPKGGPNVTTKYNKDGTLKSTRTTDNNVQTTVYYNKDGTVNHVSVIDYNTGMQTLTYYREKGVISQTTFNSRGDIVRYQRVVENRNTSGASPGSKPSNNSDLTGVTENQTGIIVDPNATPEQLKDYEEAINYLLKKSPKFRELYQKIQDGSILFYVRFSDYSDYTHIDLVKGKWVITWDRISALYVKSKRAYQNSALGLAHEFGHAAQVIDNNYLNQSRDQREEDNLSMWETPIAKELGLPYRNNYKDGRLIRTTGGPLSTVDANPSKGINKLIEDLFNL